MIAILQAMSEQRKPHLDPARRIVADLGGPTATARIAGVHVSQVYRWMWPEDNSGYGGWIPRKPWRKIQEWAKETGQDLGEDRFRTAA